MAGRPARRTTTAILAPLVLAACTSARGAPPRASGCTPGVFVDDLGAVAVAAVDDAFAPACIVVDAGTDGAITVVVRNDGRRPHTFTIADQDVDVHVDAGQVAIVAVAVTSGEIPFVCTIHPGMAGRLRTTDT